MTDGDKAPAVFGPVSDARPQSFAAAEMITCDACLRANPPTRANCLYCGANLPVNSEVVNAKPAPQQVDERIAPANLDPGFYVVLTPGQTKPLNESSLAETAAVLGLKTTDVGIALGLDRPVPLARTATREQAGMLVDRLLALGVKVDILREDTLSLDLPILAVRSLAVTADGLAAAILRGETIKIAWDDLVLIVIGRLVVKRVETEERRRRSGAKPLDSRSFFSDEPVMDLYTRSDEVGFRIRSGSFDFSCLGPEKSVTAFENFTKLLNLLRLHAPKVEVDDAHRSLRAVLESIWPLEPQTSKGEWRRSAARKVDVSTITTVDNEIQFNSYSRVRQQVKLRELENDR